MLDRNQFKATNVAELKKLKEQEDQIVGSGNSREFIEILDGSNKIRIAPKFPEEKDYRVLRMVHWGSYEKEDGNIARIPILNSKIHGGTVLDIFEEYIQIAKKALESNPEKMKVITDFKKGISSTVSWWSYGWKIVSGQKPKFGIFEFKKSVRDALDTLAIIEDEDEAIEIDPFTDVETGKPIIVKYDSKAKKPGDYYKVQLGNNAMPLTDEMFEELLKQKPLTQVLRNIYTFEDFEKALNAIRLFDVENEIDIYEEDEFQDSIVKVRAQYSTDDVVKKDKASEKKKAIAKVQAKDEEEEEVEDLIEDKFTDLDREELKEYIGDNEYTEVIKVKKSDSDEDIRNKIRAHEETLAPKKSVKAKVSLPEEEEEIEEEEVEEEEETKPAAKTVKKTDEPKPKMGLDELRAKLKAGKKKEEA